MASKPTTHNPHLSICPLTFAVKLKSLTKKQLPKILRVLLAKQPDISEPTFLTQYQIIYNMKSTYRINVPGTKIWNLGANTVPWGVLEILAPRQKQVNVPPTFFELSIEFLVGFYLLSNILKIWIALFPFWQDMAIFQFQHGQKWKILTFFIKPEMFIF